MGHCVRLIRALVCQPQPELTEEERQKLWVDFKTKAKHEGWKLSERYILDDAETRQSINAAQENNCASGINCLTMSPVKVKFEDDWTLTGSATITYSDGKKEDAQVVHHLSHNGAKLTIVTPTKEFNIEDSCIHRAPIRCPTGTAITTASDGTKSLSYINGYVGATYPIQND